MRPAATLACAAITILVAGGMAAAWRQPAAPPAVAPAGAMIAVNLPGRSQPLHVARHEVSYAAWQACHAAHVCAYLPPATFKGDTRNFPVTRVSAIDIEAFLLWANGHGGPTYRLPTPEEWRLIAAPVLPQKPPPRFTDPRLAWAAGYGSERRVSAKLKPFGSFTVSPQGIADLDGNVWEWTSGCVRAELAGSACPALLAMGEHEAVVPVLVRDPARGGCATGVPPANLGFRLVSEDAAR